MHGVAAPVEQLRAGRLHRIARGFDRGEIASLREIRYDLEERQRSAASIAESTSRAFAGEMICV